MSSFHKTPQKLRLLIQLISRNHRILAQQQLMHNQIHQLLDGVKDHILSILELSPQAGWTQVVNEKGYTVHTKENPQNGLNINRTETFVHVTPQEVITLLLDRPRRKEYDENFAEAKLLEDIDQDTKIFYEKGKPPVMLVDARDFVVACRVYKIDKGLMIVSKSVEHQAAPPVKGVVRGEMVFNAWIVTESHNGQSRVIVIGNMNPKGDLPKALLNKGAKMQQEIVKNVVAYIQKNRK